MKSVFAVLALGLASACIYSRPPGPQPLPQPASSYEAYQNQLPRDDRDLYPRDAMKEVEETVVEPRDSKRVAREVVDEFFGD